MINIMCILKIHECVQFSGRKYVHYGVTFSCYTEYAAVWKEAAFTCHRTNVCCCILGKCWMVGGRWPGDQIKEKMEGK